MTEIDISKFMTSIVRIRNAADHVTVSGHENTELINYIYVSCNELLKQFDAILNKQLEQKEAKPDDSNKNS